MTGRYLLDANALIALVLAEHEHHARAAEWAKDASMLALCPIVEGALYRFMIRAGASAADVAILLEALYAEPKVRFWPDSISYRVATIGHVHGHRQVTDAYLASLAAARNATLATFDSALARTLPDKVTAIP